MLPIVALLALTMGNRASAQQFVAAGDEPAAVAVSTELPSSTAQPAGNGPEQAGDLYQAKTRSAGEVGPPTWQSDPVPGALNPPSEPLDTGRPADSKE